MVRSSYAAFVTRSALAAAALAMSAFAATAYAATETDPVGDFLATYSGPHNGDLDATSVGALDDGTNVTLTATFNGTIGATPGAAYVLGVDRGAGLPLFTFQTPSVGAGVIFDAVAVLLPGGGSFVAGLLPTMTAPIALSNVTFSGSTLSAVIPLADLPSTGFAPAQYLYNLWPRDGLNSADNTQISDFAPDSSSFTASVPEPAAWALMVAGFGLVGGLLRRRSPFGTGVTA
jgi:hypothetical protein